MSDSIVAVYTANHLEAEVVRGLLEASGITAVISEESAGLVYGLTVGPLSEATVLVSAAQAEAARELIAAMQHGDLEEAASDEAEEPPADEA